MSPHNYKRKSKTGLHLLRSLFPTLHFSCSASCRSPPDVDDVVFQPHPHPLRPRSPFPYDDVVSSPTFSLKLNNNKYNNETVMMAPSSPHVSEGGRATPRRHSTCSRSSSSSKLGESVAAVVKESDDPYLDFRHSMLQMIFENEIFTREDLQELLACFLRLNLPCHHDSIIQAFSEIWGAVMSPPMPVRHPMPNFGVH